MSSQIEVETSPAQAWFVLEMAEQADGLKLNLGLRSAKRRFCRRF